MTRLEENRMVIEEIIKRVECNPTGTYEEMVAFQLGTISTMLTDISKSLAILADKGEGREDIKKAPSVTPQEPKTGHWIEEFVDTEGEVRFICSCCGKYQLFGTDFCYNCGAKMESEG